MKKKLLVFHPIIAPYRIDFFNRLSQEYEVKVCLLKTNLSSQTFNYTKIEEQFCFTPTYLLKKHSFGKFKWTKGVIRTIKEFEPEVVLVSECGIIAVEALLYKLFSGKKIKVVSMIDDSYDMIVDGHQFSIKHKWAEKCLIPCFDNIICVEDKVADYCQDKYRKGIYFPIIRDDEKLRQTYKSVLPLSCNISQKLNFDKKKVFLFVGRLVALKNVTRVINTFKKAQIKDAVLVIIGEGPEEETCKKHAENCENIIFTGRLEGNELYAWYNIADVLILASWKEPFGAVTNEALLAGCTCVISQKAGSNCLIKEGVNGSIIDPYNETDIESGFHKALSCAQPKSYITLRKSMMLETFDNAIQRVLNNI